MFLLRAPRRRSAAAEGSEPLPSTAAAGVAAEREPPRRVAESEEVDLVPPGAGELPHKVARSGTGRSSALRRPSTVRPGAARPGLCSPLPARWLCRTCRLFLPFGFPGFPPPLFTISFPYGYGKGGKKKKKEPIKAAAHGRALPPAQFAGPPSGPAQLRAAPWGKRDSLRAQESAASSRFSPRDPQDAPRQGRLIPWLGAAGGQSRLLGVLRSLCPSPRRVAGLPCARGGGEPGGAGRRLPARSRSVPERRSRLPPTHTPRSRVGRARGAAGPAAPRGGSAPEISARRATVAPPG